MLPIQPKIGSTVTYDVVEVNKRGSATDGAEKKNIRASFISKISLYCDKDIGDNINKSSKLK